MKKLISILITFMLLVQIAPAVSAKQKGDWNSVKAFENYSIAVKTKLGETYYGLMQSVDDASMTVQIADEDGFTRTEINFQRHEVEKVWSATLRFGEHHVVKAALIGAATGFAAGFTTARIRLSRDSSDPYIGMEPGVGLFYGAAAGALVGAFWKKKHKKDELVYSV
jgi:fructose-specific phosphotransferase system IIC component